MKFKKGIVLLFIVISAIFLLTGCSGNSDGNTENQNTEDSSIKTGDSDTPVIESITQKSGTGGEYIDIYVDYNPNMFGGNDFVVGGDFVVLINGVKFSPEGYYLNGKQFEFKLPYDLEAGTIKIAVELGGKKSNEVEFEILPPEITSIDLSVISFMYYNDADIIISGKNLGFSTDTDKVKVTLNDQEVKIINISRTGITVRVEKGITSGNLVVFINGKEMKSFPITVKAS